jgi:hypothetical protein
VLRRRHAQGQERSRACLGTCNQQRLRCILNNIGAWQPQNHRVPMPDPIRRVTSLA